MLQRKLPSGNSKRYCGIQSCINFKGSSTGEYIFFRPPPDKYTYDKWKEAIGEHQQIRHLSLICELHFRPEDIIRNDHLKTKKRKLKTGSIPVIFATQPSNAIKVELTNSKEPVQYDEEKFVHAKSIEQQANEQNHSMNCQNCIDQKIDVQELNQKLEMQVRLTEYWKAIALKYEPEHEDPKWSIDYVEKVTIELLDVPPPSPPPEKVFKPYQCGTCNKCFEQPRALERHLNTKHFNQMNQPMVTIQKCIVCCENFDKDEIERHLCIDQEKISCEYCEKEFSSTSRLLKHLFAAHKNKQSHKCNKCQKCFGMNLLLVVHNRFHDKEAREIQNKLKCSACSILFSSSANLERHQKFHCSFIKCANAHLCEMCGSNFQHIDELKQHMQLHNEFQCSVCFQFFKTNFKLKRHHERHHRSPTTASDEMQMDQST